MFQFPAGRKHSSRGGTGFGTYFGGIEQQDAALIAGQAPGDGRANNAAAGDDDVEAIRHNYEMGGDVSKGFTMVMEPNSRPAWKSSLRRKLDRVRSAAATISPSQKETRA